MHAPCIEVIDQQGRLVPQRVGRKTAKKLVRSQHAIWVKPQARIRLVMPPDIPAWAACAFTTDVIYGNWQVRHPDGRVMFHCRDDRAQWYLVNGLAVPDGDNAVRLINEPNGLGWIGDDHHLQVRENKCVVCGRETFLTRHHVFPYCYRREIPSAWRYKNSFHDVLALCWWCHGHYEHKALEKRREIAEAFDVPLNGRGTPARLVRQKAIGMARNLRRWGDVIPAERQAVLVAKMSALLGTPVQSEDDVRTIAGWPWRVPDDNVGWEAHGTLVVAQLLPDRAKVWEFIRSWRAHFVACMKPSHLPAGWSVDRPLEPEEEDRYAR